MGKCESRWNGLLTLKHSLVYHVLVAEITLQLRNDKHDPCPKNLYRQTGGEYHSKDAHIGNNFM